MKEVAVYERQIFQNKSKLIYLWIICNTLDKFEWEFQIYIPFSVWPKKKYPLKLKFQDEYMYDSISKSSGKNSEN